jgi:predicted metal-binding membrane protein
MDRIQKIILISIIAVAAISWILSKNQPNMMVAMMDYNPVAILLFTISWTIGMTAMMFPAITPMVLLYNRLLKRDSDDNTVGKDIQSSQPSVCVECDDFNTTTKRGNKSSSLLSIFTSSINIIFFVCSYLLLWALTGIVLLLTWSIPVNQFFTHFETQQLQIVYGIVLLTSGGYQFSSLKARCLGYCESPLSFFMRRWSSGTIGALKMGTYHGLYCLGCCWPYFLLMVALGWMNLLWMILFAGVIFGEKIWSKGLWISRSAGIGLVIVGIMAIFGILIIPTDMNNNKTGNTDYSLHTDNMNMNMEKSKNTNVKKPTQTITMLNE